MAKKTEKADAPKTQKVKQNVNQLKMSKIDKTNIHLNAPRFPEVYEKATDGHLTKK